jgi:hypothetical protein
VANLNFTNSVDFSSHLTLTPEFNFFLSLPGTLAARGLEEHDVRVSLSFAIIVSFMLFTVLTLANVLYFEEFLIHNSRGFMILKNN